MGDTQPSAPSPAPAPGSGGYGGGYGGGLPTSHPMFAAMSGGQMQMPGGFPPAPGGFPPAPGGGLLAPPSMLGMGMGMGGPPGPPGGPPPGAPGGLDMTNPVIAKQVAAQNAAAKLMQEKNFGSMGQPADQGGGEAERGRPREVSEDEDGGRRKRKKRWGDSSDRAHGVMAIIPKAMTDKQQQVYVMHVQIQEIGQKLMMPGLGINYNDPRRSPSPEPVYSHDGKRMNTREMRTKKKLEETRHDMIEKVRKLDMNYKPPAGYVKREIKIMDKIPIPQDEHPHIGFMGLLIGPRGNTLKKIQQETRCKVMIRGKGTEKEGKGRSSNKMPQPGDGEPMHAIVEAPTHEFLKKGCDRIRQIIKVGIECPDGHNELKRMQLRELAALNGTLREEEMMARCTQCGSFDHKTYQCKQQKNFVNETKCGRCGGMGHMTSDCTVNLEVSGRLGRHFAFCLAYIACVWFPLSWLASCSLSELRAFADLSPTEHAHGCAEDCGEHGQRVHGADERARGGQEAGWPAPRACAGHGRWVRASPNNGGKVLRRGRGRGAQAVGAKPGAVCPEPGPAAVRRTRSVGTPAAEQLPAAAARWPRRVRWSSSSGRVRRSSGPGWIRRSSGPGWIRCAAARRGTRWLPAPAAAAAAAAVRRSSSGWRVWWLPAPAAAAAAAAAVRRPPAGRRIFRLPAPAAARRLWPAPAASRRS